MWRAIYRNVTFGLFICILLLFFCLLLLNSDLAFLTQSQPLSAQTQIKPLSTSTDVHQVFRERREHLQEVCRRPSIRNKYPTLPWVNSSTYVTPGPMKTCVPYKVASSAWRSLIIKLRAQNENGLQPATAIMVRHPLSRLASAYRDKYLAGAPISSYDDQWRNRTGSIENWRKRWHIYWLPTLISSGRLKPKKEYLDAIEQSRKACDFLIRNWQKPNFKELLELNRDLDESSKFTAYFMFSMGRQKAILDATIFAYGKKDKSLRSEFANTTFTFHDFLEFVVWTYENGVMDRHWTPMAEMCVPCQKDYQYILHLENIEEESSALLRDVGYPDHIKLAGKHRIKGLTGTGHGDDLQYYEGIPQDLMQKILKIFEADFELFGYSRNL